MAAQDENSYAGPDDYERLVAAVRAFHDNPGRGVGSHEAGSMKNALRAYFGRADLNDLDGEWLIGQFDRFTDQFKALAQIIQSADTAVRVSAERLEKRFDGLVDVVLRMEKRLTDRVAATAPVEAVLQTTGPSDYPEYWTAEERTAERRHRERLAGLAAETEARTLAEHVNYPTDYEVWRDALQLASWRTALDTEPAQILDLAMWFHNELNLGPRTNTVDGPPPGPTPTTAPVAPTRHVFVPLRLAETRCRLCSAHRSDPIHEVDD